MSEATELLEHMERASGGHGGHGKGPGKQIGITMALLGVMLAFCAAMVGSARTDLIRATVEQSNRWGVYQAEATKFRVMQADADVLHALIPNKAEVKQFETRLAEVKGKSGKGDDEDTAEIKETIQVAVAELADLLAPDQEDQDHLHALATRYKHDMAEAKEDAEAYNEVIQVHHEEAEWYERAQLCAEIGIVIASIALLLANRGVWLVSVAIGLIGGGIVGTTFVHSRGELAIAEHKIEEAATRTASIMSDEDEEKAKATGEKPEQAKPHEAKPGGESENKAPPPPH